MPGGGNRRPVERGSYLARRCTLPRSTRYLHLCVGLAAAYGPICSSSTSGGGVPTPPKLLLWVYLGRILVAVVVFVAAAFYVKAVSSGTILTVSVAALAAVGMSGFSVWYTHVRRAPPTLSFLYAQVLFDLALVTTARSIWVRLPMAPWTSCAGIQLARRKPRSRWNAPAWQSRATKTCCIRVVVNLVLNAVQATDGSCHVRVEIREASSGDLPRGAALENPVLLRVTDDGPGIPAQLRNRLFDPFVTGRIGGTGLGLAIVQRAVQAHRGLVLVDSQPDRGTVFSVLFPAKRAAEVAA